MSEQITLRPYQEQILKELQYLPSVGFLMGTGTGKTITALTKAVNNKTEKLLVICPHSVVEQWETIINKYFKKFHILEFKKSWTAERKNEELIINKNYNTVIINFEVIYKMDNLKDLINDNWTIIIDESHRFKAYGTKRSPVKTTHAILELAPLTIYKIILTATPTQGDFGGYIDYYTQLYFLGYINYSYYSYKGRYCIEEKMYTKSSQYPINVIKGYKNVNEIDNILRTCCRRYDANFGDFEPQHIKIEFEKPKSYNKLVRDKVYNEIVLSNIARKRIALKTLCTGTVYGLDFYGNNHYSYYDNAYKIDWLSDFLQDTNETVAIYYQYDIELKQLEKLMRKLDKKYVVINGNTKNKYAEVNNKNYDVLLGQFQAASESLDGLQHKCHIMIDFALPESSLLHKQHIGRIDRDGQTKVPMYYYLVTKDTIEDAIYTMTQSKVEFSEATLDKLLIDKE